MKINDKSIMHLAANFDYVDKQGFLYKRGEINRSLQRRWFVLTGNLLFYFEKQYSRDPIGVVVLEGCIVNRDPNNVYGFLINFAGDNTRIWIFSAESREDMESWMQALAHASYDHMRDLANDLERQINELRRLPTINYRNRPTTETNPQFSDEVQVQAVISDCVQQDQRDNAVVDLVIPSSSSTNDLPNLNNSLLDLVEDHYGTGTNATDNDSLHTSQAGSHTVSQHNNNKGSGNRGKCRSFEEMHEEFGDRIRKRLIDWEQLRTALISEQSQQQHKSKADWFYH